MGCNASVAAATTDDAAKPATDSKKAAGGTTATTLISGFEASPDSTPPDDGLERASTCYFPTVFVGVPLIAKSEYNHNATLYTFGLPDGRALNLPVCACILLKAPGRGRVKEGGPEDFDPEQDAVRPYTPVSDGPGKFQLLVKRYDSGAASQYLYGLDVGATVEFKHIKFNIKAQYPFQGKKTFTMLCGGTGIAPIYQALSKLMGTEGDEREIVVLYGNSTADDILLKSELASWAKAQPKRLKVVHVVGSGPDAARPTGWVDTDAYVAETGWVDEAKIKAYAFPPAEDTMVFVCGVPSLYDVMCGPRTEKALKEGSVLATLGYTEDMVSKM